MFTLNEMVKKNDSIQFKNNVEWKMRNYCMECNYTKYMTDISLTYLELEDAVCIIKPLINVTEFKMIADDSTLFLTIKTTTNVC